MKVLITGGSGFIGRNIIEQLGDRHEFIFPNLTELDLVNDKDVSNYLKKINPDLIIHGANVGGLRNTNDPHDLVEINLRMFFNIVKANTLHKRMITLGSGAEYDKQYDIISVSENDFDIHVPADQYGFTKYIMSKFAGCTDNITHLRLFGIYGKYEDYRTRFISQTICKALLDLPIIIRQNVRFDYLYVNDFVKILDLLISKTPTSKCYNIGRGIQIDLITITNKILNILKKDVPVKIENDGMNKEYTCNIDRLKNEFSFFNFTDFDQSLVELVDYYREILPKIDRNILINKI